MGKTVDGERIWLDPERTPPYAFYQYWLNPQTTRRRAARRPAVRGYARSPSIDELKSAQHDARSHWRNARQRELARDAQRSSTAPRWSPRVEVASRVMFWRRASTALTDADLACSRARSPRSTVLRTELATGVGIIDLLARTVAGLQGAPPASVTHRRRVHQQPPHHPGRAPGHRSSTWRPRPCSSFAAARKTTAQARDLEASIQASNPKASTSQFVLGDVEVTGPPRVGAAGTEPADP